MLFGFPYITQNKIIFGVLYGFLFLYIYSTLSSVIWGEGVIVKLLALALALTLPNVTFDWH